MDYCSTLVLLAQNSQFVFHLPPARALYASLCTPARVLSDCMHCPESNDAVFKPGERGAAGKLWCGGGVVGVGSGTGRRYAAICFMGDLRGGGVRRGLGGQEGGRVCGWWVG